MLESLVRGMSLGNEPLDIHIVCGSPMHLANLLAGVNFDRLLGNEMRGNVGKGMSQLVTQRTHEGHGIERAALAGSAEVVGVHRAGLCEVRSKGALTDARLADDHQIVFALLLQEIIHFSQQPSATNEVGRQVTYALAEIKRGLDHLVAVRSDIPDLVAL